MSVQDFPDPAAGRFPTTPWSRLAAAADPADPASPAALDGICRAYWYPIYALVRRRGFDPDEAADLTQGYFARLLERGSLAAADRARGRFRDLLRTDCGFFLADHRDHLRARKRGGGEHHASIDARDAEGRYRLEPVDPGQTPDRLFDRAWAIDLLGRALDRVGREQAEAGRAELFERLKFTLVGGAGTTPYAEVAARLGMTEAAVQQAAHRLRKTYRAALREQVAATLDAPAEADVDDEIRALFAALGG